MIDTLKAAFVQGRLTKDEFDLRVGQTFASRTYAELAAVTADLPVEQIRAQPPKLARAQGEQPVLQPRPVIIAATVLYAGVWPLAFLLPENSEGDPKAAAQLIFSATFVYLAVLAIAVGHAVAGWRKERSGAATAAAGVWCGPPGIELLAQLFRRVMAPSSQVVCGARG